MSIFDGTFLNTQLSKHTSIFFLRLWVVIGILIGVTIVFILFLISLCVVSHRCPLRTGDYKITRSTHARPTNSSIPKIHADIGRQEHRVAVKFDKVSSGESKGIMGSGCEMTSAFESGSRWYTLRELEDDTCRLCPKNIHGEGDYGIAYYGVLIEDTKVAVKNLLNNKGCHGTHGSVLRSATVLILFLSTRPPRPPQQQPPASDSIDFNNNHHQHPQQYPRTPTRSSSFTSLKGCCCLFLLLSFLELLTLAIFLIIHLVVKTKKPQFDLQQVGVQYMGITNLRKGTRQHKGRSNMCTTMVTTSLRSVLSNYQDMTTKSLTSLRSGLKKKKRGFSVTIQMDTKVKMKME
ncbi:kinase superfamily protein, putative [Medicago truncatula]|uniref:non-specific serine/threonine protein kinase n=1 Tax=Medicago truncatula TaxID=3880 RepID=G7KVM8_MEDTR|nr:kinase superfamily protein, putative [Medicago truncatula]